VGFALLAPAFHPFVAVPRHSTASAGTVRSSGNATLPPPLSGWWRLSPPGASPPNRTDTEMTYVSEGGYVVLFGGCPGYGFLGQCARPLGDTWEYGNGFWSNITPTVSPSPRSSAVFADDPADGYSVLFGGIGPNGTTNQTWTFANGTWTQLHPAVSPPPLAFAAMAYDPNSSELVLVGGLTPGSLSASSDTWLFHAGVWTNDSLSVRPPGWVSPFLGYDPATGHLLLFGGVSAVFFPSYTQQTWAFLGDHWANLTAAGGSGQPGSRAWALGGYDPVRRETLMYGGGAGGASILGDLWSYSDRGSWSQLSGIHGPPGGLYQTTATWDARDGYLVDFGEESLGSFYGIPTISHVFNHTWALLPGLTLAAGLTGTSAHVSETVGFSANCSGGLPPYQYNWTFGDGTNQSTSNGTHLYPLTGSYNVTLVVTDSAGQQASFASHVNVSLAPPPGSNLPFGLGAIPPIVLLGVAGAIAAGAVAAVVLVRRRPGGSRSEPVGEAPLSVPPGPPEGTPPEPPP
jgi:hypothetical protein